MPRRARANRTLLQAVASGESVQFRPGAVVTEHVAEGGLSIEPIEGGFRVVGQIDLATVDRFRQATASHTSEGSELIVDLSDCSFLGSEGIGVLIDALRALGSAGRLVLRSPRGIIRKVLDLAGLAKLPNVRIIPA